MKTTACSFPTVTTGTPISENDLWKAGGTIENTGGASVSAAGICLATHANPTISDTKYNGEFQTSSNFSTYIFLNANTTYYIRAFATNMYGTAYSNEVTYTTGFAVGLYHQGGVIFYVDATEQHGCIASLQDQSSGIQWSPVYTVTNATSTDGAVNTTRIINTVGPGVYAAKLCRDYRGGDIPIGIFRLQANSSS